MRAAAGLELRPFRDRIADMFVDLGNRLVIDQRALLHALFEAVAHPDRCRALGQLAHELVVDTVLHIEAVGADAGLSGVAILRCERTFDCGIDVGVVEHDERSMAAELECELLDRRRALRHQQAAYRSRAGERQVSHGRTRAEHLADLDRALAVGSQHVDHAIGQARAPGQFSQRQRRQRRLLCRLDHDGAAGGERRRDFPRDHRDREIPRRDRGTDTDRLLECQQAPVGRRRRQHVAVHTLGFLGKPFDEAGAVHDLAARLGHGFALLGSHQQGEVIGMRDDQVEPSPQDHGALLAGLRRPARESLLRGDDCLPCRTAVLVGHGGDHGAIGRIDYLEARIRVDPVAVQEGLGAQQGTIGKRGEAGGSMRHGRHRVNEKGG